MSDLGFGGGEGVSIGFTADEASLARLSTVIESAITKGMATGFSQMMAMLQKHANFQRVTENIQKTFSNKNFSGGQQAIKQTDQYILDLIATSRKLGNEVEVLARQTSGAYNLMSKEAIKYNLDLQTEGAVTIAKEKAANSAAAIAAQSANNERLLQARTASTQLLQTQRAEMDQVGRVQRQESQESVIATRVAGQQRVAITRGVVEAMILTEKGFGVAVTGVAHVVEGVTKTIGHAFSSLGSIIHRGNSDFTEGLSTSLTKRETMINESYARQTRIMTEQVTKQARINEEYHAATQTGVIGGASKLGLGGGLLAAGGIFTAVRSTFKVGSEFVRGLAVLQQQLNLTGDQMKSVRQLSIDLGNDITLPGVSALDAANAIVILTKQFGSLGSAAPAAAEAAAKGTLQLSRAVNASAEDAAGVIGAAVNVFGVSADKAVAVADLVAGAITKGAGVSFTDFADSFKQGASVFSSFVVPAEGATAALTDFNAALAVMAKSGIVGGGAGAALKQFFILGERTTGKAGKAAEEIVKRAGSSGTLFFDINKKARNFSDTLDILRKGIAGMSDAQRNATLVNLFGSRGIQAANALLRTSADEYANLRNSIGQQGLAARIAAAQNTGFKGALDALQSVVETVQILFYEKLNPALGKATLWIANLANAIFFGSGAWATLRKGLLGAAEAIGGLIAVKGGIEVLKLIGLAIQSALTPMGLFVVAIAAIGAAIQLGIGPFKSWGDALAWTKARAADLGKLFETYVMPILKTVGNWITNTAIPKIKELGVWVGQHLVAAFHAVVGFIKGTAWPALQQFWAFLERNFMPTVRTVRDAFETAFGFASAKVAQFWGVVHPLIQPAIDGFEKLGAAVMGAVHGDFGGLGSGAFSALKGVGGALANIGSGLLDALKPVGEKIIGWLRGLFTMKNLGVVVDALSHVLETVGYIIGRIFTSPQFVAAVAAIAVIALKLGASLVKGLAEGIIANLPGLWKLLKGALETGFKALMDPKVLFVGFTALLAGKELLSFFRTAGTTGAEGFMAGFKTRFSSAGGFLSGTILGPDFLQGGVFGSGIKQLLKQFDDLSLKARALGSTTTFEKSMPGLRALQTEVGTLSKGLSDAQVHGLVFRQTLKEVFTGGSAGIIQGIKAIGTSLRENLGGAALAGIGGFLGGKAAGGSAGGTILAALTAGAAGFAVGGPIAGVIGAGAALIGSAFSKTDEAAKAAKERIGQLSDAIKSDLAESLKNGTIAVINFQNALAGGSGGQVETTIASQLGDKAVGTLAALGLTIKDVVQASGAGGNALSNLLERSARQFSMLHGATASYGEGLADLQKDITKVVSGLQPAIDRQNNYNAVLAAGKDAANGFSGAIEVRPVAAMSALARMSDPAAQAIERVTANMRQFVDGMASIKVPAIPTIAGTLTTVSGLMDTLNAQLDAYLVKIGKAFGGGAKVSSNQAIVDVANAAGSLKIVQPGDIKGAAEQAITAANIGQIASDTIAAGIKDGTIKGVKDAAAAAFPLLGAALQSIDVNPSLSPEAKAMLKQSLIDTFQGAITEAQPSIDGAARTEGTLMQLEAVKGALANVQAMKDAGIQVGQGYIDGLVAQEAALAAEAAKLGAIVPHVVRDKMIIQSPSKVMIEIGQNIGKGLIQGITDSTQTLGDVLSKAITDAVTQAQGAMTDGASALASAAASLFGSTTGSGAVFGGGVTAGGTANAIGGITGALQSFLTTFEGEVSTAFQLGAIPDETTTGAGHWAVNKKTKKKVWIPGKVTPGKTASQAAVADSSVFSLDPGNVVGAQNYASLSAALDQIANLGKTLLSQGDSIPHVTKVMNDYVAQLEAQATQLGFNTDQIKAIVDAFGLSDTALAGFAQTLQDVATAASAAQTAALLPGLGGGAGSLDIFKQLEDKLGLSPQPGDNVTVEDLIIYSALNPQDKSAAALVQTLLGMGAQSTDKLSKFLSSNNSSGSTSGSNSTTSGDNTIDQLPRPNVLSAAQIAAILAQNGNAPGTTTSAPAPLPMNDGGPLNHAPPAGGGPMHPFAAPTINIYPPFGDPTAIGLGVVNAIARTARING